MAHMPKTPRRSLRSYLCMAPVIVARVRDTEILADIEAMEHPTDAQLRRMGQFSERKAMGYALGKVPKPSRCARAAEMVLKWVTNILLALVMGAAAIVGLLSILPPRVL